METWYKYKASSDDVQWTSCNSSYIFFAELIMPLCNLVLKSCLLYHFKTVKDIFMKFEQI